MKRSNHIYIYICIYAMMQCTLHMCLNALNQEWWAPPEAEVPPKSTKGIHKIANIRHLTEILFVAGEKCALRYTYITSVLALQRQTQPQHGSLNMSRLRYHTKWDNLLLQCANVYTSHTQQQQQHMPFIFALHTHIHRTCSSSHLTLVYILSNLFMGTNICILRALCIVQCCMVHGALPSERFIRRVRCANFLVHESIPCQWVSIQFPITHGKRQFIHSKHIRLNIRNS